MAMLSLAASLRADDITETEEVTPPSPVLVFTCAGIERVLTDANGIFEAIGRPDMKDVIAGYLDQVGNLQGIDAKQPFGMVLLLDTSQLPPRPKPVGFIPVENIDNLLKTISLAPVTATKVEGKTDTFEIEFNGERGGDGKMVVKLQDGYAFFTEAGLGLDEELPDMASLVAPLNNRYDAALSIRMNSIPIGIRQVFVNFLRASAETELQQRDDEPESQYLLRRANGVSVLEFGEQILLEGEDITIGWDASPENKNGVLEFSINATPDSEFAKYLSDVAGKPSMFAPLREDDRPLSLSLSWSMNKREKTAAAGVAEAAKLALSKELPDAALPGGPIENMFKSIEATIDAGHADFFMQFAATDPEKFVLVGGVKVVGGDTLGTSVGQLLDYVNRELIEKEPANAPQIITNAESHQNISFHKIIPKQMPDDQQRMYGGVPDIYLGSSSRVFWFAVGGSDAIPELSTSIDTLLAAPSQPVTPGSNSPFQGIFRVSPWMKLPQAEMPEIDADDENADLRRRRAERRMARQEDRRELAEEAFKESGSDAIRVELKPTDAGMRLRVQFDEGFLKMFGMGIVREYDRSQLLQ